MHIYTNNCNNIIVHRKHSSKSDNKKRNAVLGIAAGAIVMPIIPMIDGDSFKKTFGGKNAVKFGTGMAAIGGFLAATYILTDKYVKDNKKSAKNKYIRNSVTGAITLPLIYTVDYWSKVDKKPMNKKILLLSVISGGAIGVFTTYIRNLYGKNAQ